MKAPAFQFYVDNFIEGTCDLNPHDVGCYIRLLCFQWTRGSIPDDKTKLHRIAGGKVSDEVLAKFKNGKNERLEQEREKQAVWREKSRMGGLRSAAKRGAKLVEPPLQPPLQPKGNIPSPPPLAERESNFAECPPMSRKDFDALAEMRAIPKECADWFWNIHDARNWLDNQGHPIRKVEPLLINAQNIWRAKNGKTPFAKQTQSGQPQDHKGGNL
jgi:hypothetical protein